MTDWMQITREDIESGKSPAGGFTRAQLKKWGVDWPPTKGWQEALIEGRDPNVRPEVVEAQERSAEVMLDDLVVTLVSAGMGNVVTGIDGLIDYYGGRIPSPEEIAENQRDLRNDQGEDLPWM